MKGIELRCIGPELVTGKEPASKGHSSAKVECVDSLTPEEKGHAGECSGSGGVTEL